jgi:hypothetical protein
MTAIVFTAMTMKGRLKKLLDLDRNVSKSAFIYDRINNKINFKDQPIKVEINGIFALRKNVQMYQWFEIKGRVDRRSKYIYSYSKKWSSSFIDSRKFQDKTKNNYVGNIKAYTSKVIPVGDIVTKQGYTIAKKYFRGKISYKKYEFKNPKIVYMGFKIKKNNVPKYRQDKNYYDLDSYVAAINKKKVKKACDEFRVINGNTLYSGENFSNPKVGDIRIDYDVAIPNKVFLVGKIYKKKKLVPCDNMIKIDPKAAYTKNKFLRVHRMRFSVEIVLFCVVLITLFHLTFKNISRNFRREFLRLIPILENYFSFKKIPHIEFIIFLLTIAMVLDNTKIYPLAIAAMLLFAYFLRFIAIFSK